jgi:hypothetical protein
VGPKNRLAWAPIGPGVLGSRPKLDSCGCVCPYGGPGRCRVGRDAERERIEASWRVRTRPILRIADDPEVKQQSEEAGGTAFERRRALARRQDRDHHHRTDGPAHDVPQRGPRAGAHARMARILKPVPFGTGVTFVTSA